MKDKNTLRLRLVVRRNALPEVRIIFPIQLDTEPTIANLLEQVNEIVPLESNDWGLEDYSVELRDANGNGFECLHFQPVSQTLNNDEEVYIRPLDTGDRCKRRLSGRYQISRDGKRLIDGIAFGRPRLKTPRGRPPIDIPPLKRPRIAFESDAEDDHEDEEPRLLLTEYGEGHDTESRASKRARFNDDEDDDYDEEDDEDYGSEDEEDENQKGESESELENEPADSDLEAELRDLQADTDPVEPRDASSDQGPRAVQLPNLDLQTIDKISALRVAFPTAEFDACEKALSLHNGDVKLAYQTLQAKHRSLTTLDTVLAYIAPSPSKSNNRTGAGSTQDDASDAESVASVVRHYDLNGFPSGSILNGTASAQLVEAMRKSGVPMKSPVHTKFAEADGIAGRTLERATVGKDGSASDATSTSDDSDNHDSDDEYDESGSESEDSGSEGEDSDSDSDSGPEVASSKPPLASTTATAQQPKVKDVEEEDDSTSESEDEVESNADSSSVTETSESDHDSDDDSSSQESGSGSSDSNSSDSESESDASSSSGPDACKDAQSSADNKSNDSPSESDSESDDDEDGSDSSSNDASSEDDNDTDTKNPAQKETSPSRTTQPPMALITPNAVNDPPRPVPPGQGKTATQKRNARRRAARRARKAAENNAALSAALLPQESLDPVAAKKAELLQRLNLMPGEPSQEVTSTRPTDNICNNTPASAATQHQTAEDAQSNWRDKIVYRAVECVEDGVELSEPPFPFVQRWDPQQQFTKKQRNGRSKRKERDNEQYLESSSWTSSKRQKSNSGSGNHNSYDTSFASRADAISRDEAGLNYDDDLPAVEGNVAKRRGDEDEDSIPPLPANASSLPVFDPTKASPGMVITWKQLVLSKATNWQPQVLPLTGKIINTMDGNTLMVRLAKRDWNRDRNEKMYDEDGNRVFDKFELPVMDDEGEESEEDGYRTLGIADMIDPRILQPSPQDSSAGQPSALQSLRDTGGDAPGEPEPSSKDATAMPEAPKVEEQPTNSAKAQPSKESKEASETVAAPEITETSISEDRRHEISLLINDAGFRKDVDPSVMENAHFDLSSPSRQLEEMSHDAALTASSPQKRHSSPQLPSEKTTHVDSQPIILEPFHGFSDAVSEPRGHDRVVYPQLTVPPSEATNCHSGRQVDPDFSVELGEDLPQECDDPAGTSRSTLGRRSEDGQVLPDKDSTHDPVDSDSGSTSESSLPSLSDLWRSTSSTASKSPSKQAVMAAIKARKSEVARDLEYEAAMQRIDDAEHTSGDEARNNVSKIARRLVETPIEKPAVSKPALKQGTQKSSSAPVIKTERESSQRKTRSNRSARPEQSSFVIPPGSQVVSLISSSPEPELEEHYAEDSIDETYQEPGMPTGSGWVPKKTRPRRGVSVPPAQVSEEAVPKRFASSQSRQSQEKRPGLGLGSLFRSKKKSLRGVF
ncbi:hypothetical protein VTJ04DRAFT_8395 [Mycothermus thermophilus]|uniref:uncharacterized protein n=1 Tax=Humicola insolens TaxID=85995 RepID=UPI0037441174